MVAPFISELIFPNSSSKRGHLVSATDKVTNNVARLSWQITAKRSFCADYQYGKASNVTDNHYVAVSAYSPLNLSILVLIQNCY
jgi:hypothetical protein